MGRCKCCYCRRRGRSRRKRDAGDLFNWDPGIDLTPDDGLSVEAFERLKAEALGGRDEPEQLPPGWEQRLPELIQLLGLLLPLLTSGQALPPGTPGYPQLPGTT